MSNIIVMPRDGGRQPPVKTLGETAIDLIDKMMAEQGAFITLRFLLQQAERISRDDYNSMLDPERVFGGHKNAE